MLPRGDIKFFSAKQEAIEREKARLQNIWIRPDILTKQLHEREYRALELLRWPEISYRQMVEQGLINSGVAPDVFEQIEIQMKYHGYIERQVLEIERHSKQAETKIPPNFDYDLIKSLSNEVRQKLKKYRPVTIGQAARISGVTPAAISVLLIYLS